MQYLLIVLLLAATVAVSYGGLLPFDTEKILQSVGRGEKSGRKDE